MSQNVIVILFYSQDYLITQVQIHSMLSLSDRTSTTCTVVIFVIAYLYIILHM